MHNWLIVALLTSWMMTGIIWFVQWVHYPLFGNVGPEGFADYEKKHAQKTFEVLLLPLGLEFLSGIMLVFADPGILSHNKLLQFALALQCLIYAITFFVQMPLHRQLESGFSETAFKRLVSLNWPRTVLWTLKSLCLTQSAFHILRP